MTQTAAPAPKLTKPKTVRLKGPPDLTARVISKLRAGRPKDTAANRDCTFEVTRSSTSILSRVKHVLATGIESYDAVTGIGGLPFGRVIEIYGLDGAAKSAMALRCAVRLQMRHIYERVPVPGAPTPELRRVPDTTPVFTIYIDNEQSIDEDGKTKIDGVELDIAVARCDTIDQMFKIIDTAIDGVDEVSRETGAECFIAAIVDTIAGTSSREEVNAKWEDVDYTRQPKQLREGFRIMMRKIARRNVLAIFTNQVSDKYDKRRGPRGGSAPQDEDFSTFGGRALEYFASLRIFHVQTNPNYKLSKKLRFPSGRCIQFTVTKNRLGKPTRSGRMVLLYDGGLNDTYSTLETLVHLKLAERTETGEIKFRFKSAGIETTTFDPGAAGDSRERSPTIFGLEEWPAFYQAHQADFAALWKHGLQLMFQEGTMADPEDVDESVESEVDVAE